MSKADRIENTRLSKLETELANKTNKLTRLQKARDEIYEKIVNLQDDYEWLQTTINDLLDEIDGIEFKF